MGWRAHEVEWFVPFKCSFCVLVNGPGSEPVKRLVLFQSQNNLIKRERLFKNDFIRK